MWKLAPLLGTSAAEWAWDDQFSRGVWEYLDDRDASVAGIVAQQLDRVSTDVERTVVDLGCGVGNLAFELPRESFSRYIGVDVSRVAISDAARRAERAGGDGFEFVCEDLRQWRGVSGASVIVIEEALYYLGTRAQCRLLDTCEQSLADDGALILLIHDPEKHPGTTRLLERRYGRECVRDADGTRMCMVVPSVHEYRVADETD